MFLFKGLWTKSYSKLDLSRLIGTKTYEDALYFKVNMGISINFLINNSVHIYREKEILKRKKNRKDMNYCYNLITSLIIAML